MKNLKTKKFRFLTAIACLSAAFAFGGLSATQTAIAKADEGGERTVLSYFSADEGITLTPDQNTPTYVTQTRNGLLVESTNGGTVTYENLIDVTNLTKNDLLFELQAVPTTAGVSEMNQILVRLEDSENPKIGVDISIYNYTYKDAALEKLVHITAKPNSVEIFNGFYYSWGSVRDGVRQGSMIYGSFAGTKAGFSNSFSLYYDNEDLALFTAENPRMSGDRKEYYDEYGKLMVLDMDNPDHMGINKANLWSGFPSGKIRMSFTTNELVGDTAKYMILTIDNQTFDGTMLNDTTAPDLSVDLGGYTAETLPAAKTGSFYPFFSASATDKMYDNVNVKTRLYYEGEELYYTGNGFVPEKVGEYVVEYSATDGSKNAAIERYTITATDTLPALSGDFSVQKGDIDFTDESLKNANGNFTAWLYYPVQLPAMNATGGSGNAAVEAQVYFHGKKIEVIGGAFVPEKTGMYEVKYVASDYLGNTETFVYTVEVSATDVPLLSEPTLPSHLSIGKPVEFPKVQSELYTVWKQKLVTYDKINIYKADGTTLIKSFDGSQPAVYTPTAADGESVIVEYSSAKDATAQASTYRKEIVLMASDKFADRFYYDESVDLNEKSATLNFTFTEEGKTVRFINPLSVIDGTRVVFRITEDKNAFEELRITFIDSVNANVRLDVNVYKNPDETAIVSFISVNGGKRAELSASFYGNVKNDFIVVMQQDGGVYNFNGDLVAKAENFAGFASGFVYVEFAAYGIDGDATLSLKQLKNQVTGDYEEDYIKPVFIMLEEPVGYVDRGEYVTVGAAIATDVYDVKTSLSVSVSFNEQPIWSTERPFGRFEGTEFLAYDYGIYELVYVATDSAGNSITRKYRVEVRDEVAPVIVVEGEMPTTAKAGKALSLPNVYATDNVDVDLTVYVIVIDPMNSYVVKRLDETYYFVNKGRYIVRFYCEDSRYNTTYTKDYYITVD